MLVRVIVPKKAGARFDYRSVRPTRTDLPTLTCASVREGDGCRFVIGSRPARAMIFAPEAGSAEQMAEQVQREAVLGSNMRGSAAYRRKLVGTPCPPRGGSTRKHGGIKRKDYAYHDKLKRKKDRR